MKPLVLFGACNAGDEYAQLFRDINAEHPTWDLLGFADDNAETWGKQRDGLPVLGGMEWIRKNATPDLHVLVGIGNVKAKRRIVAKLRECGVSFATGIHPSVITSPTNRVGEGTLICPGSVLTTHVTIGNHCIVNVRCAIHHNTVIGDYCNINPGVAIAGDVTIGDSAYIGIGSSVIDKVSIGRGTVVGAGAAVVKSLPEFVTAVGVPARVIKTRENDLDSF